MTRHWNNNNKGRIIFNVIFIFFCSMLLALCYFMYPERASSGPYLNSAHGNYNPGYGVLRTSLSTPPNDYGRGNCVHCHEQHASIGGSELSPTGGPDKYALMSKNFNTSKTINPYLQSDSVCFYCHYGVGTYQTPAFSNYSYSATFGGCSIANCPTANIFDAFNGLSYHNMYDIYRFITGLSGSHPNFSNFPSDSNPCSGCHNIHIAKRSCGKPSGSFDTTKSAISKPSDHSNLWGDAAGEKMSNYTTGYQAPYNSAIPTYEPDGSAISDPSKLPDYVTFCTDCHNATNTINSTLLVRSLYKFNWANEIHGGGAANNVARVEMYAPYQDAQLGTYVLACTDCHEPHGSPNNYLVRKQVNNGTVTVTNYGAGTCSPNANFNREWVCLCQRCHTNLQTDSIHTHPTGLGCAKCHPGGGTYRKCMDCHFHGNSSIDGVPYGKPLF